MDTLTCHTKKHAEEPSKHTGKGLVKLDSKKASDIKKLALGALVLGAFTVPIFRSGGRTGLTFVGWVVNHTIFGPPVEYIPLEDYSREMEGVETPKQLPSRSQLEGARAYYQISEPSARELLSYQQGGGLMGFTLGITNAPAGAVLWNANFAEKSFDYDPIADSGWLGIGEVWNYPSNPLGCTSLHIWILDADNNILLNVYNLGPVNNGKDYIYDCSTGILAEVVVPEVVPCEITIDAPDSAEEGEKVSVSVLLKNVSSYGYMYKTEIYAIPDLFPDFRIGTIEKYINSGATFTAYGSFTMPASNTTVFVWVERWDVDHWVYDNSASKVVTFEAILYKGTISKKELEYDETRGIIPVY